MRPRFHLAIPVDDLDRARRFYGEVLACPEGRSSDSWIDFDLAGHQLVVHRTEARGAVAHNAVDGDAVPVPHFGLVLDMHDWQALADRLSAFGMTFVIEPHIRFVGEPGEQATMFLHDPAGNAIEFKAFADIRQMFAK